MNFSPRANTAGHRRARFLAMAALAVVTLDALAQESTATAPAADAEPDQAAVVQVSGVDSLVYYATVERLLSNVPGVRRVELSEADGARLSFRVLVRGGSAVLERALASSGQLLRTGDVAGGLAYHYRP